MKIIFKTNIDKYKGKFPTDFKVVPRVGEYVSIVSPEGSHNLLFSELQVQRITYLDSETVIVELHLSGLQDKMNIEYDLNLFS